MTKDQRAREQLGRLLAVERRKAGLSIADVAKRLDRRPAWVARIESGSRRLDLVEYFALADAIGCDGHALLRQCFRH
jgi:transcriptional regulator with XRE-family HTH domain